jgi:DNA-binding MarR family transcriptional regulator
MARSCTYSKELQEALERFRRLDRLYAQFQARHRCPGSMEDLNAADVRVMQELGFHGGGCSGSTLASRLSLDPGYLCRTLKKLKAGGLVTARRSVADRRMREWELTHAGKSFAARQEQEWHEMARWTLFMLPPDEQRSLVDAMRVIERLLLRYEMQRIR